MGLLSFVDYELYLRMYGDGMVFEDYDRLSYRACRILDAATTGVDGYSKLSGRDAVNKEGAESVRRCVAELTDALGKIESAAKHFAFGGDNGLTVASVSAGNESVSYRSPADSGNVWARAAADPELAAKLLGGIVNEYLIGVRDRNGIPLLYMGRYRRHG